MRAMRTYSAQDLLKRSDRERERGREGGRQTERERSESSPHLKRSKMRQVALQWLTRLQVIKMAVCLLTQCNKTFKAQLRPADILLDGIVLHL